MPPFGSPRTLWISLREEFAAFSWQSALTRMVADLIFVNLSMLAGFVLWYFVQVTVFGLSATYVKTLFRPFVQAYWIYWSGLALLVFHSNGFYTRTRSYAGKYKMLVVVRSITSFFVLFVFTDYLFFRGTLLNRGVAVLAWTFTVLTVAGSRFTKDMILREYNVEPKVRQGKIQRVLVVGGGGYVGSALVPRLLGRGYRVRVLDSLLFGPEPLESCATHPDFELHIGDVRDIEAVVKAVKDCDAIIHLAAIVGDPACEENRPLAVEVNRLATQMLIEIAKGYGVQRFLFASTCSVYGASDFLVDEQTKSAPLSTYATTKIDSEKILLDSETKGFHPVLLRLGTLFGLSGRPRFDLVVNLLTARAVTTGEITIFNGEQWRPFLHVADAARAFITCLEAPAEVVSGEIFNIGDMRMNERLSGVSERIRSIIPTVNVVNIENSDKRNYRVDFTKAMNLLGFECLTSIEEGIREIHQAMNDGRIQDYTSSRYNNLAVTREFSGQTAKERAAMRMLDSLAHSDD